MNITDAVNTVPSFNIEETVSILAKQQFYFGQDRIYGRIKQISVKIKGAGLVVHRLISTFLKYSALLDELKFEDYLHNITKEIHGLNFDKIWAQFNEKASILQPYGTPQLPILVSFLISDVLSALRVPAFDEVKNEIRKSALPSFPSAEEMEKSFDNLCSLNNEHLSLLENLSFLYRLSQAFHFKRIVRVVAIQITKHVKMTVDDLVQSGCA
jgi:hypothetical protein